MSKATWKKFKFSVQVKQGTVTVTEPRIIKAVDAATAKIILQSTLALFYRPGSCIVGEPEEVK